MDELKMCRYCKHYGNGKCSKLLSSKIVDFLDLLIDDYISDSDIRLSAEEEIPSTKDIPNKIGSMVQSCTKTSIKRSKEVAEYTSEVLEEYKEECIDSVQELAENLLWGIVQYSEKSKLKDTLGLEVDGDFYCKYWE